MATHVITRRIQLLIQYVYDSYFPSKTHIIEFLNTRDFDVSNRTLERDLERIRVDYGLEIAYNKSKDGYYINEEKSFKVDSFFKFLEIVTVADIFTDSLKNSNKILEYVSFDDSKSFKGIDNLKPILIAIGENRMIAFEHENYLKNTITNYKITPFQIKEYENRWYVIGVPGDINDIRTFGIDRITNLTVEGLSRKKKELYKAQLNRFENIIGLDYENNKPLNIRLLVNDLHIKYMRSLPLHHSQVIRYENDKGQYFVDFFLVPNYEFKSQILKMGPNAEVISPEKLKKEIQLMLENTLKRYK